MSEDKRCADCGELIEPHHIYYATYDNRTRYCLDCAELLDQHDIYRVVDQEEDWPDYE